jgi:hypothetical protein
MKEINLSHPPEDKKFMLLTLIISTIFCSKYMFFNPILWDDLPYQISWNKKKYNELFQIALDAGLPLYHVINYIMYVLLKNKIAFGFFNFISIYLSALLFIRYLDKLIGEQLVGDKIVLFIICLSVNIYSVYFIKNAAFYHFSTPIILATILFINSPKLNYFYIPILLVFNLLALTIASSLFYSVALSATILGHRYINNNLPKEILLKFFIYFIFIIIFFGVHKAFFPTSGNYSNYNKIEIQLYTVRGIINTYILSLKGIINYYMHFLKDSFEITTLIVNLSLSLLTVPFLFYPIKKNVQHSHKFINKKLLLIGLLSLFFIVIAIFPFALVRKPISVSHELRYTSIYFMGISLLVYLFYIIIKQQYLKFILIATIVFIGHTSQNNNLVRWINQEYILNSITKKIISLNLDNNNLFQIDISNHIDIPRQLTYYEFNGSLYFSGSSLFNSSYGNFKFINNIGEYKYQLMDDIFKKDMIYRKVLLNDKLIYNTDSKIYNVKLDLSSFQSPFDFYINKEQNPVNVIITELDESFNSRN